MIKLEKEELLKRAKQIRAIKGHRYLKVEDVSLTRVDTAIKSKIKTPKLIKLGKITAQVPMGYSQILRVFSIDVVDQIPDEMVKEAVAFSVLTNTARFVTNKIQTSVPVKVMVYGLAKGEKVPDEIENSEIKFSGEKFTAQEIDNM